MKSIKWMLHMFRTGEDLDSTPITPCEPEPVVIAKKEPTKPVELVREDGCEPDSCFGECGGGGDCEIAEEWQEKIHPPMTICKTEKIKKKKKNKKHKNLKKKKKKHKRKLRR